MEELYRVIFFDELLELPSLYEPFITDPQNEWAMRIATDFSDFVDTDIRIRRGLLKR